MDTRTHTPVHPTWAERARTALAAAASASVRWDGGRVDLLGCHHDDAQGDVILTLESTSVLVGAAQAAQAARAAPGGDLSVQVQLTELCPVQANQRVRAKVALTGRLAVDVVPPDPAPGRSVVTLRVRVERVTFEEADHEPVLVAAPEYRTAEPDPLHAVAADHLQHLSAHHPDAVETLARLCPRATLVGATRVLPLAFDRYGLVLRVERLRGHRDVRLPFARRVDGPASAAEQLRLLLTLATRGRPCSR